MNTTDTNRPLSPHLQVYKLPYNALMSIIGRGVGIALFIALSIIFIWFNAIVWKPELFDATMAFLETEIFDAIVTVKLLLGAFVVFFYLGNGVRHVLWDLGIGVTPKCGRMTGNIALAVAAILTLALSYAVCML